jgi:hypothetical protein
MRRITIVLVFVASLVFAALAHAHAQSPPVGTIRAVGTWSVSGRTVTDDTTPAYDGALVRVAANLSGERRRAARVVVYYSVPGQDPLQCKGADPCASGFRVHASAGADPILAKILRYVHPQPEPDLALARGTAEAVADGVVRRDGTSLGIEALLTAVTPGTYRIVVTAQRGSSPVVVANQLLDIRAGPVNVDVPGAVDGLYALQLFDSSTLEPAGNVAWLAVAAPPAYAPRRLTFDRAVAATRLWSPTPQNRAAATAFLRGLVLALADPAWHP